MLFPRSAGGLLRSQRLAVLDLQGSGPGFYKDRAVRCSEEARILVSVAPYLEAVPSLG